MTVTGAAACTAGKSSIRVRARHRRDHADESLAARLPGRIVWPERRHDPQAEERNHGLVQGTEAASTAFTVQLAKTGRLRSGACRRSSGRHPRGKRCTLYLSVGAFTHADVPAPCDSISPAACSDASCPPGSYRLRATPTDAAGHGPTVYGSFSIKK